MRVRMFIHNMHLPYSLQMLTIIPGHAFRWWKFISSGKRLEVDFRDEIVALTKMYPTGQMIRQFAFI